MAFKHGKSTDVLLDGTDLSPYLNAADLAVDLDTADTTTFKATWKTAIAGTVGAKLDFAGFYDPTVATLPDSIGVDFSLVAGVLTYAPAGALAIGDRVRLASVVSSAYAESSPVGGMVAIKWSAGVSGVVGFGDVLHVLGEDTNTTTGADKDDTAATSTGWTAHLHVTAVDAGSWVIKLQDAATTDLLAVSGGAFAAKTAAGAERLRSAASTTELRRHVRYVATRTGGAGGDGITFFLAYARN